ncbi:MAG: aspartate-semialdehyde dehydrogenase [Pseudomonas sp.]
MRKTRDVALVGLSSLAGEALLNVLDDHEFDFGRIHLLDTEERAGGRPMLQGQSQRVEVLERFDFSQVAVVLFADAWLASDWADRVVAAGCRVVDACGAFRHKTDVPLVVAEVNPQALGQLGERGIVSCPDAQVVQTVIALHPLVARAGLQSLNIATYQSMSTLGNEEVEALALQTGRLLNGQPPEKGAFDKQAAFNLIPRIGELDEAGNSQLEQHLAEDVRRILGMPQLPVAVTCVLVPTFFGTAQVMQLRTAEALSAGKATTLLRKAAGVKVLDKPAAGGYPTPVSDATGSDQVWVGRVRQDSFDPFGIGMWLVSDNLRKGVALNSLAIAQLLIKDYL